MPSYRVTVDERVYEVTVEEIAVEDAAVPAAPAEAPAAPPRSKVTGTEVQAPLSGTIISVKVREGSEVSQGDVLMTLEALKLENEITAPVGGTVVQLVSEGDTVETDQIIAVIE